MCTANFVKGMGIGLLVGSAIGMTCCSMPSKGCKKRKNVVGKALRTMGDIVENIGDNFGL